MAIKFLKARRRQVEHNIIMTEYETRSQIWDLVDHREDGYTTILTSRMVEGTKYEDYEFLNKELILGWSNKKDPKLNDWNYTGENVLCKVELQDTVQKLDSGILLVQNVDMYNHREIKNKIILLQHTEESGLDEIPIGSELLLVTDEGGLTLWDYSNDKIEYRLIASKDVLGWK